MSKILVFIRQEKGFCCTKYQVCADEGSFTLDLLAMGGDPTMAFSAEGKSLYKSIPQIKHNIMKVVQS